MLQSALAHRILRTETPMIAGRRFRVPVAVLGCVMALVGAACAGADPGGVAVVAEQPAAVGVVTAGGRARFRGYRL